MKVALFVGNNRLAQQFTQRLLDSPYPPLAIFKPTFGPPAGNPRRGDHALAVRGATTDFGEALQPALSSQANRPVEVHAARLDRTVAQRLEEFEIELIVSVCFPSKLPPSILSRAVYGGLNLHPSPLPAWRGNDPIFWQLRAGRSSIGLSLHQMTDRLDAGRVIGRDEIALRPGQTAHALDCEIAVRAAKLLIDAIATGEVCTAVDEHRCRLPRGRYFSSPVAMDYRIWPSWTCAHAKRYVGILQSRGLPFHIHTPTDRLQVHGLFDQHSQVPDRRLLLSMADGEVAFSR